MDRKWICCSSALLLVFWYLLGFKDRYQIELSISFKDAYRDSASTVIQQVAISSYEQGEKAETELDSSILKQLKENGTTPCHHQRTAGTVLHGISESPARLASDVWHIFTLVSMTTAWKPRCAGGDYYEVSLEGERWRSRPQIEDFGNGSYHGKFMVPSRFAGKFNLSVFLLFDAYHGLDANPQPWVLGYKVAELEVIIVRNNRNSSLTSAEESLPMCQGRSSFPLREWKNGHWSRGWYNHSCDFDAKTGRLFCLQDQHRVCPQHLCEGNVDRLESNGWVYRLPHCKFQIWSSDEAWRWLDGKWIFFWGDSNHADTARNLLLFVLGYQVPQWSTLSDWHLPRSLDKVFSNPSQQKQRVRITLLYNGHVDMDSYGMGLGTMYNASYRSHLLGYFNETKPDVVVMNSGLHDGFYFTRAEDYVSAIDYSIKFWEDMWKQWRFSDGGKETVFIYRTTVAPAGHSRSMKSNPCKMEVFNELMVERLKRSSIPFRLVDGFDLTFPWHFDNLHSDGGHYGRAPLSRNWPWLGKPHYYFVDLMLAHILLNAMCDV